MTTNEMIKCLLKGGYELCMADKSEIADKLQAAEVMLEYIKQPFPTLEKLRELAKAYEKAGSKE